MIPAPPFDLLSHSPKELPMPRRRRRRQPTPDDAVGLTALVLGLLMYRQLSAISFPWTIALTVVTISVVGTAVVWVV
jgi:hypothetical protein